MPTNIFKAHKRSSPLWTRITNPDTYTLICSDRDGLDQVGDGRLFTIMDKAWGNFCLFVGE